MKPTIVFSNYDDLANLYYAGGGARAIHEVAKRLTADYKVLVLVGNYPGSIDRVYDNVTYVHIGPKHLGSKIGQICFQLLLPFYAFKLKYSVWFDSFTPPLSLGLLPLLTNAPVVGLIHMLPGSDMRRKYYLPFDVFERLTLKLHKNYITMSDRFAQIIKEAAPSANIVVAANGVTMPAKQSRPTKATHLLFLGRIEVNQKGIDLLLKSYKAIVTKTKLPLLIVGSGIPSEMTKLRKLIRLLGLQDRVQIVGKQDGKSKEALIRGAACIIVPSRFETFSLVALETMSYSIPLVTFDIDGLEWIPKKLRYVAHSFDVASLGRAILKTLTPSSRARTTTAEALKFARSMGWEKTAGIYKLTIQGLLS